MQRKSKEYKISRVINNNVVTCFGDNDIEVVLMGKGISFQRKVGDEVPSSAIEKTFVLKGKEKNHFFEIAENILGVYIDIAMEIMTIAEEKNDCKSNPMGIIMLADHICSAVERAQENIYLKNEMLTEIKRFYPQEFSIAEKGICIIKEKLNVDLPSDEAGFIAFHILTSSGKNYDHKNNTDRIKIINKVIEVIESYFDITIDKKSVYYDRFITHLKYFSSRIFQHEHINVKDDFIFRMLRVQYPNVMKCVNLVQEYLDYNYKININNEEKGYLIIHIVNLLKSSKIVT